MAKQLKKVFENIEQDYGKGMIFEIGDKEKLAIETIPSSIVQLDEILGGGVPKGRITEISGMEASGKTTTALKFVASAQKIGNVAFIDTEHALDLEWAKKLGVNADALTLCQPTYGEQALDIVERLIHSEQFELIVVDSVAALVPKAELEGEIGDAHIGLQARLMSQFMRRITAALQNSRTVLIFINQLRLKIGILFGNPETTTGGLALKFYAAIRLHLTKSKQMLDKKEATGVLIKAKTAKNKIIAPFKNCEFIINFNGQIV